MKCHGEMQGIERAQRMIRIPVDQIARLIEVIVLDGALLQPTPIQVINEGRKEQGFQFRGQLLIRRRRLSNDRTSVRVRLLITAMSSVCRGI